MIERAPKESNFMSTAIFRTFYLRRVSAIAVAILTASPLALATAQPANEPPKEPTGAPTQETTPPPANPEPTTPTNPDGTLSPDAKPATPSTPPATPPKSSKAKPATVPTKDDILEAHPRADLPKERIVLLGEHFDAEFCFDEATRATGMGGRSEFPEGTAMIFVHPRPIMLNYWMKDCLIDMDMIFVDGKGRVTALHEATREKLRSTGETKERYESRLYRYGSRMPAQFVIELPPGSIKRLKPMVSQQLGLDWSRYAQRAK